MKWNSAKWRSGNIKCYESVMSSCGAMKCEKWLSVYVYILYYLLCNILAISNQIFFTCREIAVEILWLAQLAIRENGLSCLAFSTTTEAWATSLLVAFTTLHVSYDWHDGGCTCLKCLKHCSVQLRLLKRRGYHASLLTATYVLMAHC